MEQFLFFLAIIVILLYLVLRWPIKKLQIKPISIPTARLYDDSLLTGFLAGFCTALFALWIISSPPTDEYGVEYEPWMPTNEAIGILLTLIVIGYFGLKVLGQINYLVRYFRIRGKKE